MLHCDLSVRWKVASDLRFRAAISEPKTSSFCGISGDLAQSTRKSLAIAIVRFWCAKPHSNRTVAVLELGEISPNIFQKTVPGRVRVNFVQNGGHEKVTKTPRKRPEHCPDLPFLVFLRFPCFFPQKTRIFFFFVGFKPTNLNFTRNSPQNWEDSLFFGQKNKDHRPKKTRNKKTRKTQKKQGRKKQGKLAISSLVWAAFFAGDACKLNPMVACVPGILIIGLAGWTCHLIQSWHACRSYDCLCFFTLQHGLQLLRRQGLAISVFLF